MSQTRFATLWECRRATVRYSQHVATAVCDTPTVPHAALTVPDQAPQAAGSGTITATSGAKSAQTGTAFIGYISTSKQYKSITYIENTQPKSRPMASIFESIVF